VQSAGRELGYDAGGLGTPRRAGAVRRRGSAAGVGGIEGMTEKERAKQDTEQYKAENERMEFLADRYNMSLEDVKKEIGSKSSDKTESLAKTNVSSVFGETPAPRDKIYEGTTKGGYRAFSDTQREGYNEYQPTRLVSPDSTPAPMQTQPETMYPAEATAGAKTKSTLRNMGRKERISQTKKEPVVFTPEEHRIEGRKPALKTFDLWLKKMLGIKGNQRKRPLQHGTFQEKRILEEIGRLKKFTSY